MTAWKDRTLEQQTAYVRKTYARAPIRSLTRRIIHEQTANDVLFAEAQFDQWLADIATSIHSDPAQGGIVTAPAEVIDAHGREIPIDVAASVMYLKSMGYDAAADCLRDGWHGPASAGSGTERGRMNLDPNYIHLAHPTSLTATVITNGDGELHFVGATAAAQCTGRIGWDYKLSTHPFIEMYRGNDWAEAQRKCDEHNAAIHGTTSSDAGTS